MGRSLTRFLNGATISVMITYLSMNLNGSHLGSIHMPSHDSGSYPSARARSYIHAGVSHSERMRARRCSGVSVIGCFPFLHRYSHRFGHVIGCPKNEHGISGRDIQDHAYRARDATARPESMPYTRKMSPLESFLIEVNHSA